jgi:hypothetical protein
MLSLYCACCAFASTQLPLYRIMTAKGRVVILFTLSLSLSLSLTLSLSLKLTGLI